MASASSNYAGMTHIGYRRQRNEDRFLVNPFSAPPATLLAVADGMGGEPGGDISAQIVMDTIGALVVPGKITDRELSGLLVKAGDTIRHRAAADTFLEGMGTTATVAFIANTTVFWSHVGDSRLYLFRNAMLTQATTDHTFLQDLIDDGTVSPLEAQSHPLRNVLDQCVGCANMAPDSGSFEFIEGDALLLCTDGLTRLVPDPEISEILQSHLPMTAAEHLVEAALKAGGKDNITVVVMKRPDK